MDVPFARIASFALAALALLSCSSEDKQRTLVSMRGEGQGDFSWAGPAGFDGNGRFIVLFTKGGWRAYDNGKWVDVTYFNGICDTRETPAEGALLFGTSLYEWNDGAFRERVPLKDGHCISQVAVAGSGDVFAHGYLESTLGAPSVILRAQSGGTWAAAFPDGPDLANPGSTLRDGSGNVWVLGAKGIVRIASDGKSFTKVADCSHPLLKPCELGSGVVAPNDDLYFVIGVTLHRVRASDLQIERLIPSPDGLAYLNGYDVAPDGTIWAVYGTTGAIDSEHVLFQGRAGGTFAQVAKLDSNGYRVAVSNQGKVVVYEIGHVDAAGPFEVR